MQPVSCNAGFSMFNSDMLTGETVNRLLSDPSPQMRVETAAEVARTLSEEGLSQAERHLAGEILSLLARDLEVAVRQAVAEHAKSCPFLPPSVARRLAEDVESVALPVIRYSSVLSDDDLIAVIQSGSSPKHQAAASREVVSSRVCEALIEYGDDGTVKALLANAGARIPEPGYHKVITDRGTDHEVQRLMIDRALLPMSITERLIGVIAEDLRQELISRQELPPEIAEELAHQGRERTLAQAVKAEDRAAEVRELAKRLHAKDKLTPSLMLRSLCLGDLRFFEAAMALRSGIPIASARLILQDGGGPGFQRLYRKANLPPELSRAFMIAVELVQEVGWAKAQTWRPDYSHIMLARLASEIETSLGADMEAVIASVGRLLAKDPNQALRA